MNGDTDVMRQEKVEKDVESPGSIQQKTTDRKFRGTSFDIFVLLSFFERYQKAKERIMQPLPNVALTLERKNE